MGTFSEIQHYRTFLNRAIMIVLPAALLYPIILLAGSQEWLALAPLLLVLFLVSWLFWTARLSTFISEEGIRFRWAPVSPEKQLSWKQIREISLLQYEFLGWGIRISGKYGMVYNMSGNWGLRVITSSGESFLIGVKDASRCAEWLEAQQNSLATRGIKVANHWKKVS